MIDPVRAAAMTIQHMEMLLLDKSLIRFVNPAEDSCGVTHLKEMVDKMVSGEVTGEKAHRWLGWIQGVLTARGFGTLEQYKLINARARIP